MEDTLSIDPRCTMLRIQVTKTPMHVEQLFIEQETCICMSYLWLQRGRQFTASFMAPLVRLNL